VYLRESKRTNRDGSVRRYLALAHNYRDPDTGRSKPQILYSFGRLEDVDRDGLERLVASIARFLDDDSLLAAVEGDAVAGGFEAVDARNLGGAWVLDRLWERLGIGTAIKQVARGRKLEVDRVERVLFALVAGRCLAPSSKLEATRWIREETYIEGLAQVDHKTCYRAMDFLLDALGELQETVFFTVADLLQLDVDLLFFDTTSTYFELEQPDDDHDDGACGFRTHGHSKDHRTDLPQVVIGMAVTRGGVPVRLWVWPGNTTDMTVLGEVRDDLAGWRLNRTVWVTDAGFNSADNRRLLQQAGSGFIVAEKLRSREAAVVEARGRPGRFRDIGDGLEVKEITVGQGVTAQRFIMCRNLDVARRDAAIRDKLVGILEDRIDGSDTLSKTRRAELRGQLKEKPGLFRYLRTTKAGMLRVDRGKVTAETKLDGKFLLRCSDPDLDAAEVARGYKALADVERGWRDLKQLDLRPVYHRLEHRIVGHVQLCWLALLLIRTAEQLVGDTWRNIATELERIRLVTLDTGHGTVAQRTRLTGRQRQILDALGLSEPPRYFDFTPAND
jgi:hypothetical protein